MKYGYVKVSAASPDLRVADVDYNTDKIIEKIEEAEKTGIEVLVFPELCLCGYTVQDIVFSDILLEACLNGLIKIAEATEGKRLLVYVGLPFENYGKVYNCAAAVQGGAILALIPKTYYPNGGEFYEKRHFSESDIRDEIEINGNTVPFGKNILITNTSNPSVKVGAELCEDLWRNSSPSDEHVKAGATIIVNLSASCETVGKDRQRKILVSSASMRGVCGYVYANAGMGESTGDYVFSGNSMIAENGEILTENPPFGGEDSVAEIDVGYLVYKRRQMQTIQETKQEYIEIYADFSSDEIPSYSRFSKQPFLPNAEDRVTDLERILTAQAYGLKKRMDHVGAKKAVIGLSGGLDSALAFLVICRAFELSGRDKKDITCVSMPCFGTSKRTFENSKILAEEEGAELLTIDLTELVKRHLKDISHEEGKYDTTYENAQARARTYVLMDLANDRNGIVVGTGDLSELALGWCTYNGDHMSMYSVNGSIPKTLVRELVAYEGERIGGKVGDVLSDILHTEISPELLPTDAKGNISQKTEDLVGPYLLNDYILYHFLYRGDSPKKIYAKALATFEGTYDKQTVKKQLLYFFKRFFTQAFKRSCMPDGVKIGILSLSPRGDLKMPSDASYSLWKKEIEELD